MEKVQLNSNKKNEMDLNNRKMTNHPPSPDYTQSTSISGAYVNKFSNKFSLVFRFTSAFVFLPYRDGFSLYTCSCTVGKNGRIIQFDYRK